MDLREHSKTDFISYSYCVILDTVEFYEETKRMDDLQFDSLKKYLWIIILLITANVFLNAYWLYDKLEEDNWKTADYEQLWELMEEKKYESALKFSNKLLLTNPDDDQILWGKAESLYHLQRFEEAIVVFSMAKEIRPDWTKDADEYIAICNSKLNTQKNILSNKINKE
jgi:tetratricopeptide (TPR) repeat protein